MNLPVSPQGIDFERKTALLDAKWVVDEYGDPITFYERDESNVTRDKYNSIKVRASRPLDKEMRAFPIQTNPIDKDLTKAGLREKVDVIAYTAMQDWNDANIDPWNFDINRSTVTWKKGTYKIKERGFANQFEGTYLNVTLGLERN